MKSYEVVQQMLLIILFMEMLYALVLYSFHLHCFYNLTVVRHPGTELFPIGCGIRNMVFLSARTIIFATVIVCQVVFGWGLRAKRPELMWPWVTLQVIIFSYSLVRLGFVAKRPLREFAATLHWILVVGSFGCFLDYWVYIEYREYNAYLAKEKDSMYKGSSTFDRRSSNRD